MATEEKPSVVKKTVLQIGLGVALGFLAASVLGPQLISWWYQPPSQDAFSCAGSVKDALAHFVWLQLICAALGGFGLWLVLFLGGRALRNRGAKAPSP
jgi:hypothetical protein